MNFGLYLMNYYDKLLVMLIFISLVLGFGYFYLQDCKMIGVSMNFLVGNWVVGIELFYCFKDLIMFNIFIVGNSLIINGSGCLVNGNCYVEMVKYQLVVIGLLSMILSDNFIIFKMFGGVDIVMLMVEVVGIYYFNMKKFYQGILVVVGNWGWGYDIIVNVIVIGFGLLFSVGMVFLYGYNLDFSWVYDGLFILGWQVVLEIFYFQVLYGCMFNFVGIFMQGVKLVNFIVSFIQNLVKWQFLFNYVMFWGGDIIFDQLLCGCNFVGVIVIYNF